MNPFKKQKPATTPPTRVEVEERRDQARLARVNRELDRLQESEACGDISAEAAQSRRANLNRQMNELQVAITQRRFEAEQEAARLERRRTQMPADVARLTADVEAFLSELPALRERARSLHEQAEHIRRSYGRDVAGHILGIPEVTGLADGYMSIFEVFAARDSRIPRWLEHARNMGLAVPAAETPVAKVA